MSSFYQSVISIISKPSENRLDEDIDLILNWFVNLFRKKSAVFGDISAGLCELFSYSFCCCCISYYFSEY